MIRATTAASHITLALIKWFVGCTEDAEKKPAQHEALKLVKIKIGLNNSEQKKNTC